MREVNISAIDLNLLPALEALLKRRNVSHAAHDVGLSQPAMSAALARLRDYFGDELLVLQGKRMHPTAFANELVPQIKGTLAQLEAMLAKSPNFDPATSQRIFRIVTSDAGGGNDFVARLIAQGLTASLGQQGVVDNRPAGVIPSGTNPSPETRIG